MVMGMSVSPVEGLASDRAESDRLQRCLRARLGCVACYQLVESEHFPKHFANVLRSLIISGNTNNQQAQFLVPGFEAWLKQRLEKNVAYDRLVFELLTSPAASGRAVSRD